MPPDRPAPPPGLPGLAGIEHIGLTVPDLEVATRFFVEVIGCEQFYDLGPFRSDDGWMERQLGVPEGTVMRRLRFLRCGQGPNIELFEYEAPGQATRPPCNSDIGGHHLAFYVRDIAAALAHLRRHGVEVMGMPTVRSDGPSAGQTWVYFRAPWGLQMELVSFENGKGYERSTDRRLWHPGDPAR